MLLWWCLYCTIQRNDKSKGSIWLAAKIFRIVRTIIHGLELCFRKRIAIQRCCIHFTRCQVLETFTVQNITSLYLFILVQRTRMRSRFCNWSPFVYALFVHDRCDFRGIASTWQTLVMPISWASFSAKLICWMNRCLLGAIMPLSLLVVHEHHGVATVYLTRA